MQYERQERVPKRVPRIRKLDTLIPTSNRDFGQWNYKSKPSKKNGGGTLAVCGAMLVVGGGVNLFSPANSILPTPPSDRFFSNRVALRSLFLSTRECFS